MNQSWARRISSLALLGVLSLAPAGYQAGAPGGGTVPGLAYHRGPVGGPLPPAGPAGDGGPVLAAAHQPAADPGAGRRRIVKLRVTGRLGPARIAFALGLKLSTGRKVLTRYRCPPLGHLDRATGTGAPV
jgi:hypothetical protein